MEEIEYDYVSEVDDNIQPTLDKYLKQFDILIGDDILTNGKITNNNIRAFISYVDSTSSSNTTTTAVQQQSYIMFVISICMHSHYSEYKRELCLTPDQDDVFYDDYYFPLLYSVLSSHLDTFRRLLSQHDSKIYKFIEDKASDIIGFSLAVYNLSANIIKIDTRRIFFKTFFIETSPYNIPDVHSYYYLQLQYIYCEYIKNKTEGLIPIDDLIGVQNATSTSTFSRMSIYEYGIRNHRIKLMCAQSDTLQTIDKNYDKLRGRMLNNTVMTLFKKSRGVEIKDSKTSLVYLNSMNLASLEDNFPLICKLLRSIRVRSDSESFTEYEKVEIRDLIYTTTLNKLSPRLGIKSATQLAAHLSQSLASDLVTGEYIDPRTMSNVTINTKMFISQFQRFLLQILDSLVDPV